MAANWKRRLPRVIETTDGQAFKTLDDARKFVVAQRERNEWQNAAGKLMAAAEGGDLEAAVKAVVNALFIDGLRLRL